MIILKRVLSEKGAAVLVATAAIVFSVCFYIFIVYPWNGKVEHARQRVNAAGLLLSEAMRSFELAEERLAEMTTTASQLRIFYNEVLPSGLAGARVVTYPRFSELARTHNLILEQRSSSPDQDEDSQLLKLHITMRLGGRWSDIRRFIYGLESGPEFIVIERLRMSESSDQSIGQVLEISLATYFQNRIPS